MRLQLEPHELEGDLPLVCARSGVEGAALTPAWFASVSPWVWLPLGILVGLSVGQGSWGPLASWWGLTALAAPVVLSRGVTGRVPLSAERRQRIANLRRRRLGAVMGALATSWLAVGLWLLGSVIAARIVLLGVVGLYLTAVAMTLAARSLGVRGRPTTDGGVVLREVDAAFADAVELRRAGHRP